MSAPSKPCKFCKSLGHWPYQCFQRTKKPKSLKRTRIRQVGKYTRRWFETRDEWIKQNPAPWVCHYGGCPLDSTTLQLDHAEARSRRPDLRFDLLNLVPACNFHNKEKGSLSHDEYRHVCHKTVS